MTGFARPLLKYGRTAALCVLLAALLCACGKPAAPTASQEAPTPALTATPAPTNTPAPTPTPTNTPVPTPDPAMQSVTYAWISDTQGYSADYRQHFIDMVQWIVDSRAEWNTQYVLHTGDVINDMLREKEWQNATDALTLLNGELPLFMIAGNHDIKGMVHDYAHFGELLSKLDYKTYPTFGGEELNGRRRYDLVTIGHDEFLLIGVGYSVSAGDAEWLDQVLQAYPTRTAILVVHWYLDLRDDEPRTGDAETLYRVVGNNPNVRYVLCGHRHNLRSLEQRFDDDGDGEPERSVAVIMADYQGFPEAGGGYVVMMTFDPEKREIRMTAYSPLHDDYNYYEDASRETYTLPLNVVGG